MKLFQEDFKKRKDGMSYLMVSIYEILGILFGHYQKFKLIYRDCLYFKKLTIFQAIKMFPEKIF